MQRLLACVVARLANMCDIQFGVTSKHRTLLDGIAVAGAFCVALLGLSVVPRGHRRRSAIGISVMLDTVACKRHCVNPLSTELGRRRHVEGFAQRNFELVTDFRDMFLFNNKRGGKQHMIPACAIHITGVSIA